MQRVDHDANAELVETVRETEEHICTHVVNQHLLEVFLPRFHNEAEHAAEVPG